MDPNVWGGGLYCNEAGNDSVHGHAVVLERIDTIVCEIQPAFIISEHGLENGKELLIGGSPTHQQLANAMMTKSLCDLTMEKCSLRSPVHKEQLFGYLTMDGSEEDPLSPQRMAQRRKLSIPPIGTRKRSCVAPLPRSCSSSIHGCALSSSLSGSPIHSPRKRQRRFPRRNSVVIHPKHGASHGCLFRGLIAACRPLPVYPYPNDNSDDTSFP